MTAANVVLEWTFTPPGYFESPITISCNDYTMTIGHGKAEAKIESAIYDANTSMRKMLHETLNDRFLGVQLFSHRAYELSNSTIVRVRADGHRDIFLELGSARLRVSPGNIDVCITDEDGNIIADSKRDRIEKKKSYAELVATHRPTDDLLAALLSSYNTAVRDPDDELVHLYEIREALSKNFGGDSLTRAALGTTASQWSRLGQLCNDEPLRQGRHRGKAAGPLRDATESELTEARSIAQGMIFAYLQYLESS